MIPEDIRPIWVDTPSHLQRLCTGWSQLTAIAIDTEFVRQRTFYPALGLIQIGDSEQTYLIDPLACEDLKPLAEILRNPRVTKIFHSCSEDLEVLYHRFGEFPAPIFDTQIAAAFAGHAYSMGYARLVEELCEVHLPKGETRTNWLRRPLTDAQMRYAALDVLYLLPIWDALSQSLKTNGRLTWAEEEFAQLGRVDRFLPDPETLYLKVPQARALSRHQQALLQQLYSRRERTARRRNLPRNFVIPEASLLPLARLAPRHRRQLDQVEALRPGDRKRHGDAILELVRKVYELSKADLAPPPPPVIDLTPYRETLKQLRQVVEDRAAELGLPAEMLATTRMLKALLRNVASEAPSPFPPELSGWRRSLIGEHLMKRL